MFVPGGLLALAAAITTANGSLSWTRRSQNGYLSCEIL